MKHSLKGASSNYPKFPMGAVETSTMGDQQGSTSFLIFFFEKSQNFSHVVERDQPRGVQNSRDWYNQFSLIF